MSDKWLHIISNGYKVPKMRLCFVIAENSEEKDDGLNNPCYLGLTNAEKIAYDIFKKQGIPMTIVVKDWSLRLSEEIPDMAWLDEDSYNGNVIKIIKDAYDS